jgi:hypothetical protein
MSKRKRSGNTPVEQQERSPREADANRPVQRVISGPGAADFIAAPGGMDRPESGTKGMAYTRGESLVTKHPDVLPRPGPDTEATPGQRQPHNSLTGSQTGTIGGGGPEARPATVGAADEDTDQDSVDGEPEDEHDR